MMRIDGLNPNTWRNLNQKVQENLGADSKVFVYPGIHHALFEICLGLHLRLPQKRKIVSETGWGDHLRHTEIELAKLGVRFKSTFEESMAQEEKATLAYVHDLDDSFTGELFDHSATLKSMAESRIHRIHIAHHLFQFNKSLVKKLGDYDIFICGLNENYALVFTGEKVSLPSLTVSQLPWSLETDGNQISHLLKQAGKEYPKEIQNFEANLPQDLEVWFDKSKSNRIFDRALVIVKNQDSSALQELLVDEMGFDLTAPGEDILVESPSFCRWANEVWFDQAAKFQRSREQIQGLLIVKGEAINADFAKKLERSLAKLKAIS